ncbi:hypothetical protein LQZ18_11595 [Lachnospiraceae bacterium ZAX-1]
MADSNVLRAQTYLNAMFGGHKDWVTLAEDGATGTATMQGIILCISDSKWSKKIIKS